MTKKGYLSAYTALLLLFGHMYIYYQIVGLPVSEENITAISQIVYPIIGASLVSAVLFVIRQQHQRLSETEDVNWLFGVFVAVLPTVTVGYIVYSLSQVGGNGDVPELKTTIAVGETFFGGVFVLVVDALFGGHKSNIQSPAPVNQPDET
jgi:membrane protease YdiL (CAAX protease family)